MAKKPSLYEKYGAISSSALQASIDEFFESNYVEDERIPPILARSLKGDNDILAKIGQMAVEWSEIERWIDQTIWRLLDVSSDKGACVTGQFIGPGPRCKALVLLCQCAGLDSELIEKLREFEKEASAVGAKRNRFMHDQWIELIDMRTKETKVQRHEIAPTGQALRDVALTDAQKWVDDAISLKNYFTQEIYLNIASSLALKHKSAHRPAGETEP